MATSALIGAGALSIASPAAASEHGDADENGEMPDGEGELDDVDILNFALTLEYLEARFYREGLDTIGEQGIRWWPSVARSKPARSTIFA